MLLIRMLFCIILILPIVNLAKYQLVCQISKVRNNFLEYIAFKEEKRFWKIVLQEIFVGNILRFF